MSKQTASSTGQGLRGLFITGIFTVLPLAGTWVVVNWLAEFLWNRSRFFVYDIPHAFLERYLPASLEPYAIYAAALIGIATIVILTILIGLVARWFVGKTVLGWLESLLKSIPVVSWVYGIIQQFIGTFDPDKGKGSNFRKAVLIPFDQAGKVYILAFLANEVDFVVNGKKKTFCLCYYACNHMIQGYNVFVDKKDCIELEMPVDQAVQQVVSLGLVSPRDMKWMTVPAKKAKGVQRLEGLFKKS